MASDPTRIVSKQVRVIFPDGLPRGLDPSQVKLVLQNPEYKADAPVREPAPQPVQPSEHSAEPDKRSAAVPPNEPEPAAAEACPPTPPPAQNDAVPLPSPHKLSRAEAARENGRKSRGPVTAEGKARSSQNALKHGLSSRRVVIGEEEEEEWLEFQDECRQTLKPLGAIELNYADEFAASRWRLRRCLGIETAIFDYQFAMQKIYRVKECARMDGVDRTGMAFKSAKDDLTALGRYETRIRRSGERALANLLRLQSIRKNEPDEPAAPDNVPEPTPAPAPSAALPQNSPKADAPVREAAPEPVRPSDHSAVLQKESNTPAAPDDSTECPAQAPPAAVNPQNEPGGFATSRDPKSPTPGPLGSL